MCCVGIRVSMKTAVFSQVLEAPPPAPGGLDSVNITVLLAQDPNATSVTSVQPHRVVRLLGLHVSAGLPSERSSVHGLTSTIFK